ncbi:MAG: ribonuclease R [bacterium]|nr:ribonuclease R [candidate division KSB1 bacterium]MDH7561665.1 ribonuclease R [bacterium]
MTNQDSITAQVEALLGQELQRTFKAKDIAKRLGVTQDRYHLLRAALRQLVANGTIVKYPRNRYGRGRAAQEAVGVLRVKTQGYGFVVRDDGGEDIFVSERNMGLALHQDRVRVRLFAQSSGRSPEGKIVEVLSRARQNIVGTYKRGRKLGFVVPDELKIPHDIFVHDSDAMGAQPGQKVVVQITNWEHEKLNPEGRIVEVLGFPNEKGVDVLSVARAFDLSESFPPEVEQEAAALPARIPEAEIARRRDLRGTVLFTIDPPDAKDFDDAVSLEKLENGHLLLGVHIADVSWYVRPGGAIDREARRRGTSVYLVDRAIPMLPERLSSELCSLVADRDRLAYSVLMELTPAGDLVRYQFHESVIRSRRRFSYEQVQELLDGRATDPLTPVLQEMRALSHALIAKRQRRGSVDLDAPEVQVILDEAGRPVEIRPRPRLDSHRLIEEFMLLANETVARHVGVFLRRQGDHEVDPPFVYRIHEKPDRQKMSEFLSFAAAFGVLAQEPTRLTPRFFQKLLAQATGLEAEPIIRDAMLRAMMKARYSTENIGHFGLAYQHYTHFTSPIRRYPDLMVHRPLKDYQRRPVPEVMASIDRTALEADCRLASEREVVAQEAERESVKMKQVEYMAEHVGETFKGVVSRIVPFGVFVELPDLLVEGLIHVTELGDDYYVHDTTRHAMIGQRQGRVFRAGDVLMVRVARVDQNQRLVDFTLVEPAPKRPRRHRTGRRTL